MSFWDGFPATTAFLQAARDAVVARAAPVAETIVQRGTPIAQQACEQALRVGDAVARAAGPKTSSQVRGLFAGATLQERGLMRGRGEALPGSGDRWLDVTLIADEGLLKVFMGWEAMEGDIPASTIDLSTVLSIAPDSAQEEEPHCFIVVTPSPSASEERTVFQANNDEECRRWIGLLQGVSNSLALRTRAGQAINATGTAVRSRLPPAMVNSTASTALTAQARGFFTSASHQGPLQVPEEEHLATPAKRAPASRPTESEDFEMLAELEPSSGPAASSSVGTRRENFVDVWAVLALGQLKLYKDEEDFEAMGTPQSVIDMTDVIAVAEHGDRMFQLITSGDASEGVDNSFGQVGCKQRGPRFKALVPEDRATWVGLLRGVEQSLLAKRRLLEGRQVVGERLSEAANALWASYETYAASSAGAANNRPRR